MTEKEYLDFEKTLKAGDRVKINKINTTPIDRLSPYENRPNMYWADVNDEGEIIAPKGAEGRLMVKTTNYVLYLPLVKIEKKL